MYGTQVVNEDKIHQRRSFTSINDGEEVFQGV